MEEWVVLFKNKIIQRFFIEEGQCLAIGRGTEADIIIHNSSVSRKHTSLELKDGIYYLSDLHSMNGTRVNGVKIYSDKPISRSDNILIGKFILKPAEFLSEEAEVGSVASGAMGMESQNETLFVTGIHKEMGKVDAEPKKHLLSIMGGGATPARLILRGKTITVGKDPACNVVIPGLMQAKTIFSIESRPKGYFVVPQGGMFSKILLNGEKLSGEKLLKQLDVIETGKTKIRFT